jgi:hypothetical protein
MKEIEKRRKTAERNGKKVNQFIVELYLIVEKNDRPFTNYKGHVNSEKHLMQKKKTSSTLQYNSQFSFSIIKEVAVT